MIYTLQKTRTRMALAKIILLLGKLTCMAATLVRTAGAAPSAAAATVTGGGYRCATANDCELLGKCVMGRCQCYPGFTGPSCAQIDLEPSPAASPLPAWPPASGYALSDRSRRAYGWGFSVAPDAKLPGLLHAVANVGCYIPHSGMVTGTFLMHLTSATGMGPWKAVGIVAPPTTFNAHLRLAPSGEYVLFLRGTAPMPSPANWTEAACAGVCLVLVPRPGARNGSIVDHSHFARQLCATCAC